MRFYEDTERCEALCLAFLRVWEASVRATHTFLSEEEIAKIKGYVPEAIRGVSHLIVAEEAGEPVGFMGVTGERLEMLFLSPEVRGRGLGRALLEIGIRTYGVRELTVNEENPAAVGFYRHMGFLPYRRTAHDEEGNPYPLLYMRKNENSPAEDKEKPL